MFIVGKLLKKKVSAKLKKNKKYQIDLRNSLFSCAV